ncbi:MAG: methionyl-tRNA formyltransferase [Myxococcota bacterium]
MAIKVAIFGQAAFGRDVAVRVSEAGHEVVAVYSPPPGARPDPLASEAAERGWPLLRHERFRRKGAAIDELVEEHARLGADLNLMPFTTVILPPEILEAPSLGSLCFHPSLLPAYRGGAALAWQIILGAEETGVTVFRPDEGVDTGPIVVQRGGVPIDPRDTTASLYFEKLYPLGVEAMLEAVAQVAEGTARFTPQAEDGASFQGLVDDDAACIDWQRPAAEIDRLIRGCDPQPGAHTLLKGECLRLFATFLVAEPSSDASGTVLGLEDGRLRIAGAGGQLAVSKLRLGDGKKLAAAELPIAPGSRLGLA